MSTSPFPAVNELDPACPEAIGRRLREWRAERRMSGTELGAAVGLSKGKVSELERGLYAPGVTVALAIERLCDGAINAADLNEDVRAAREVVVGLHGAGDTPAPSPASTVECGAMDSGDAR